MRGAIESTHAFSSRVGTISRAHVEFDIDIISFLISLDVTGKKDDRIGGGYKGKSWKNSCWSTVGMFEHNLSILLLKNSKKVEASVADDMLEGKTLVELLPSKQSRVFHKFLELLCNDEIIFL